jgi:hypothetical protein
MCISMYMLWRESERTVPLSIHKAGANSTGATNATNESDHGTNANLSTCQTIETGTVVFMG